MKFENYEERAVSLLRTASEGVLSTISVQKNGYPFGSFSTFGTCESRSVIIYASDLAQHTKNISNNKKVSFTLFNSNNVSDKQNSERLTLLGLMQKVSNEEYLEVSERFFSFFPKSRAYSNMHDFNFYKISIEHVRWIGGFGEIAWLDSKNWCKKQPKWKRKSSEIIDHMNKDHKNVIISSLHAQHKIKDKKAEMIFLTTDGYYVASNEKYFFISFSKYVDTVKEYREILVEQAKKYRKKEL